MHRFAIIGAGTAGLACALALARRGHAVTIHERHASLEPVGAGMLIQPSGVRALHSLGVGDAFVASSVPVARLEGRSHRGWRLVDVAYPKDATARGVSRPAMTTMMVEAMRGLDVTWRLGVAVDAVEPTADEVRVRVGEDVAVHDGVIVASGGGSPLGVHCGLSSPSTLYRWGALNAMVEADAWDAFDSLQQRFHGPRRMMGLLPTAQSGDRRVLSVFWSLPVAALAAWRACDFEEFRRDLVTHWPDSEPALRSLRTHDDLSFATYRHAWPKRLASGRVCLVGDAAHAMSPQLGLGSTLAVGDALALADAIEQRADIAAAFADYERARTSHVKRFQVLSRLLTPCFQADAPAAWRDWLFAASVRMPGANALALRSLAG